MWIKRRGRDGPEPHKLKGTYIHHRCGPGWRVGRSCRKSRTCRRTVCGVVDEVSRSCMRRSSRPVSSILHSTYLFTQATNGNPRLLPAHDEIYMQIKERETL